MTSNDQTETEREKFSTLATDINRALERNDDEEYYRLTHSHPDEILKALRLAALDGGAVSQDAETIIAWHNEQISKWIEQQHLELKLKRQRKAGHALGMADCHKHAVMSLRAYIKTGEFVPPLINAALRTQQPQDQARDLLIRFATWFDRCSERPLHAHEISDSIDAFLAEQDKEPR